MTNHPNRARVQRAWFDTDAAGSIDEAIAYARSEVMRTGRDAILASQPDGIFVFDARSNQFHDGLIARYYKSGDVVLREQL